MGISSGEVRKLSIRRVMEHRDGLSASEGHISVPLEINAIRAGLRFWRWEHRVLVADLCRKALPGSRTQEKMKFPERGCGLLHQMPQRSGEF